ncbi:hypothetical protein R2F61_06735 [Mollicutes bacterium LVI A0078]|nr:hypothetical protein RZE84_06740 [Mollicutes bacterium LVI A0075]WOO90424.1 hypothetical protein R2F61_06735 [Mollicutes bacterium LVI A0078]
MFKRKKEKEQLTDIQKCIELLKGYNLAADIETDLIAQVEAVAEELEAVGQTINPNEIVSEVLAENEIDFNTVSKNEKIKLQYAGKEYKFINQNYSKLSYDMKYSGVTIDLREYNFNGPLEIEATGKYSGLSLYVNEDVEVNDWTSLRFSGVTFFYKNDGEPYTNFHDIPITSTTHSVKLTGDLKLSGIQVYVGFEGPIDMYRHGNRADKKISRSQRRLEKRRVRLENKANNQEQE